MTKIIEGILANRVAANLLMVFIVISGIASLSALNVRVFPPIETGQISVSVPYPGATPEDVETSIVRPIEERQPLRLDGQTLAAPLHATEAPLHAPHAPLRLPPNQRTRRRHCR